MLPLHPSSSQWCAPSLVQDYPLEQLYRDQRLNPIHEGTTGIHALTLLARKVQRGGAAPLFEEMRVAADDAKTAENND